MTYTTSVIVDRKYIVNNYQRPNNYFVLNGHVACVAYEIYNGVYWIYIRDYVLHLIFFHFLTTPQALTSRHFDKKAYNVKKAFNFKWKYNFKQRKKPRLWDTQLASSWVPYFTEYFFIFFHFFQISCFSFPSKSKFIRKLPVII